MAYDLEYNDKARAVVTAMIMLVIASFAAELAFSIDLWFMLFTLCVMFGGMISCAILLVIITWDKYKVET